MKDLAKLEKWSRWIFLVSAIAWVALFWFKDKMPPPSFYEESLLTAPSQIESDSQPFKVTLGQQTYLIKPLYYYELNGVVVSYSSAKDFTNIWHFKRWKDFLNLRDICVAWGNNISSGVYQKLNFSSDSWTCWVDWLDPAVGKDFHSNELSNNHLLTNFPWLQEKMMEAELGDQIQLTGHLVKYSNPATKYARGTSTSREDTGNGACETIFLTNFTIIKKANFTLRLLYKIFKWITIFSLIAVIVLLFIAPHEKYRNDSTSNS
ncbi:hypothetical protein [Legionella waltersii]|uniref:Uncharacterized protein n=1 Tax=Legionella waltersii TaxID=66969 RepID=A0A0W1ADG3_9GAMM|nr:hypothetical protein [Legionella waltersii]KTD79377.1 hypothetical protein Lwal_1449 [Legionella waltersii]SNU99714.1 Uncharacterised protein [Legionella waltersii]